MHVPARLARIPGGEEVAEAAHAHVATVVVAAQVAHRAGGIAHQRLPAGAGIGGAVDRAHIGGQLRLLRAEGGDQVGLARQFGVEEQAAPLLAAVGGVQQQTGLADDPALVTAEIDADQSEVLLRRQVEGALLPAGAPVGGLQDQAVAAHQEAVAVIAEGHIEGVGGGGQGHGLPGAGGGRRQAGGDAAAQSEAG